MSYIKREDALTDAMCEGIICQECPFRSYTVSGGCMMANYIMSIPAADVVKRKAGKWEKYGEDMQVCSACHKYWIWAGEMYDFKYCPNCGAKMEDNE